MGTNEHDHTMAGLHHAVFQSFRAGASDTPETPQSQRLTANEFGSFTGGGAQRTPGDDAVTERLATLRGNEVQQINQTKKEQQNHEWNIYAGYSLGRCRPPADSADRPSRQAQSPWLTSVANPRG